MVSKKLNLADLKKIYMSLNENEKELPIAIKVKSVFLDKIRKSDKPESYYTLGLQVFIDNSIENNFEFIYAEEKKE